MSKRWSLEDDTFIHAYHTVPNIGPHDLGRSDRAVAKRIDFLKSSGAWDVLEVMARAREEYFTIISDGKAPQ